MEKMTNDMPVATNCGSVVNRFMMPRYWPELAPPLDPLPAFAFSMLSRSSEARFGCVECEVALFSRLISTPRSANGAHEATAHELGYVSSQSLHHGKGRGGLLTPHTKQS